MCRVRPGSHIARSGLHFPTGRGIPPPTTRQNLDEELPTMRRLAGLLIFLFGVAGCAEDAALWQPALSDLRGDNQQMRTMGGDWGSELPKPSLAPSH